MRTCSLIICVLFSVCVGVGYVSFSRCACVWACVFVHQAVVIDACWDLDGIVAGVCVLVQERTADVRKRMNFWEGTWGMYGNSCT